MNTMTECPVAHAVRDALDDIPSPTHDDVWPVLNLRTGKDYIVRAATLQSARYWLADRINVPVHELV